MKELTLTKKRKLVSSLKKFSRKYLSGKYSDIDESATRLMVNEFLADILGFVSLDEIKTEYMIKGTYADYIIQIKGKRYFIVEVKAMQIELSAKHLRQTVNYAANEGIEWALLTNGKQFDFYKILFNKPIESRRVFSIDLSNLSQIKSAAECFQYLTKILVLHRGLDHLWQKISALDPVNVSRFLYAKPIINYLKRQLKKVYRNKLSNEDIIASITRVIEDKVENVKPARAHKHRRSKVRIIRGKLKTTQFDSASDAISLINQ
jgi:predicted type IV restriction endonuclease